jgi:hypothetical protein
LDHRGGVCGNGNVGIAEMNSRNLRNAGCVIISCGLLLGCNPTIHPAQVKQRQASYSSTGQDSGLISTQPDGFLVNKEWVAAYDSLLDKYGQFLTPPRKSGDRNGIYENGKYWAIEDFVLERQLKMNQMRLNGK